MNAQIPLVYFALLLMVITFVLTMLLISIARPMLHKRGVVDTPNERSSHSHVATRGLGIAILVAYVLGWATAFLSVSELHAWFVATVAIGPAVAGLLGVVEDGRGLSVKLRSVLQLLLAAAFVALVITLSPMFSWASWVAILIAIYGVLFVSSFINVANFMDGLNGISGFHGVIAGATFAVAGWMTGVPWVFIGGIIIAAVFGGFLPANLRGQGFMGDSGSYLLGGCMAMMSFAMWSVGYPILATIGPMVIYFGDVAVTMVRRKIRGEKLGEAHKEHTYQRIQQKGYSHIVASGITAFATLIVSILGLASIFFRGWLAGGLLFAGGLLVLVLYMLLPRILPGRSVDDEQSAGDVLAGEDSDSAGADPNHVDAPSRESGTDNDAESHEVVAEEQLSVSDDPDDHRFYKA